ncbi:MAG TPA: tRNA epoxyqueuosine(34) reductase QueG [Planctomycetaceae bacterium]|nr:tRNA epoxyqueuosine(34) reductase QueG [Planctomycetaceae bacterium]
MPDSGTSQETLSLAETLKQRARDLGFDLVGIAPAVTPAGLPRLEDWIDAGRAGEMKYIPNRREAYTHPEYVLSEARSVIMLAMNYRTEEPLETKSVEMRISRYAWGAGDYHDLLRERLKQVAGLLHEIAPGCRTRCIVDTAPLLERDFARLAGLGWFGKNTMLLNKQIGSWFFLGAILTDVQLPPDAPHETAHCGTCTRCLDVCPTDAFPEAGVLDARRCISYLTIELRDRPIPLDLRTGMQNWGFGCDLCQDVCPWNSKAPISTEASFAPQSEMNPANATELLGLSEEQFRERFKKTPLARPGRAGILRNAAIVLGNSGDRSYLSSLYAAIHDEHPLVRGAAVWAISQLGSIDDREQLQSLQQVENNAEVLSEIQFAIDHLTQKAAPDADAD